MWKGAKSDLSDLEKGPLERFKQTRLLAVHYYPSWEALCQNREKVTEPFWSKWPPSAKRAKFDLTDLEKMTFRAIQPNLSFDMWFMSPQRSSMPKKLLKRFWDRPLPPQSWRMDGRTDGQTDGRRTNRY